MDYKFEFYAYLPDIYIFLFEFRSDPDPFFSLAEPDPGGKKFGSSPLDYFTGLHNHSNQVIEKLYCVMKTTGSRHLLFGCIETLNQIVQEFFISFYMNFLYEI